MEQAQNKGLVLAQLFFIFVLPPALLGFGIIPISWRMVVLCVVILFMLGVIRHEKITDKELGLSKKAFIKSILPYVVFTGVGILILWQGAQLLPERPLLPWWQNNHLLFLFLPVSILQEVSYRGFLFPKLRVIFPERWLLIIANALLFTLLHVIYPFPSITLPLSFLSGIAFAALYQKYPSLFAVALSHAVLNFAAVFLGFFSL